MCLERAFSGYLAYFFEVGLRGDTKGPKRGKEGEGLSPVDIGDRASDSAVKLNCINVHPRFSGSELKKSNTGAYRARFSASFFASQSTEESIALVNSKMATLLLF